MYEIAGQGLSCDDIFRSRYAKTIKLIALSALDFAMTSGWVWVGSTDVIGSEDAVIPAPQRLTDAKQALSGWLYFQNDQEFEQGFVESVKERTAADFGIQNNFDVSTYAMNLYDVSESLCMCNAGTCHVTF